MVWESIQDAPEESAGIPLIGVIFLNFRCKRREASPRPIHGEISALLFQAEWNDSQTMGTLGIWAEPFIFRGLSPQD